MESDFSLFVGDLSPDVDDATLDTTFRTYYPSTKNAKVMLDPNTQRSRGYGFVRFALEAERDRALTEMNGVYISTRPVRVSLATARKPASANTGMPASTPASNLPGEMDSNNTTLFIGGLAPAVTEADLNMTFSRFGELVYTKIPANKGCGFVQFLHRPAAEYAMSEMSGQNLGGQSIRISWGRSQGKPPPLSATTNPQAVAAAAAQYHPSSYYGSYDPYGGAYGGSYGAMGYDPYAGYSAAAYPGMDPSYASAYAGYPGVTPGAAGGYGAAGTPGPSGLAANTHQSGTNQQGGTVQAMLYDPSGPVNTDKMNMAYMHRHMPRLSGAHLRMPVPLSAGGLPPPAAY